jgi:Spy/CpxP family protein refolding chaperone
MQEGMNAMGRVKDLTSSGKSTEVVPRLFHAGAKDFFLDHTQHITLSAEQKKKLNQIKEQALLDKASANRKVQEAEQQLWKSTASDQPDPAEIEIKVRQVEKLRADQRIGFIRAVDQAVKVLTAEQHQAALGGSEVSTHSPNK